MNDHRIARSAGLASPISGFRKLALAGFLALSACTTDPGAFVLTRAEVEEQVPLHPVPISNAWVSVPDANLVMQRNLGYESEQRINLRNRSLVPGDNVILMRARSNGGRLRFEEFRRRVGGMPAPFENLRPGELATGNDDLGPYLWAERRFGADTICVLGMRRIDSSMRQVPGGEDVLDIMIRNCVVGTADEALRPMMGDSVGTPPAARDRTGDSRLISPLAGPTVR